MILLKRVLFFGFLTGIFFSLQAVQAEDELELKIKNQLSIHCNITQQNSKLQTFLMMMKRMPVSTRNDAFNVMNIVLPQICFFDYPAWLIDRAFNLSVYGIHDGGLKPATIKKMTEFMRSISVGKQDYITYGKILENMLNSGVEKEYVNNFIHAAIDENYGPAGAEALAYYYVTKAIETRNHDESLKYALNETKSYKSQYDRFFVLNKLYGEKEENSKKVISAAEQEKLKPEMETKHSEFWKKYQNKVRLTEKFSNKKVFYKNEDLIKLLSQKVNTQYGYRMNKGFGIDGTGLVAFITNSPVESLPYVYNTYCSSETVNSTGSLKTADIVLFSDNVSDKEISGMGIYLENQEFVYVNVSAGLIKADLNDPYYKNRFVKGCRIPH